MILFTEIITGREYIIPEGMIGILDVYVYVVYC